MLWLLYTIIASLGWATSNFFDKYLATKLTHPMTVNVVGSLFAALVGGIYLFIVHDPTEYLGALPGIVIGVTVFFSVAMYLFALRREETSRVVPLWSLTAIFVPLLGFILLDEPLTIRILLAAILVVAGAALLQSDLKSGIITRKPRAALLMIGGSFIWAIDVIIAEAYAAAVSPFVLTAWTLVGTAVPSIGFLLFSRSRLFAGLHTSSALIGIVGSTIFDVGATVAKFAALALAIAAYVEIAAASQYIFVFVGALILSRFAPFVAKEKTDGVTIGTKLVAILLIIAGVTLIALP